jgi:hypothetical protein
LTSVNSALPAVRILALVDLQASPPAVEEEEANMASASNQRRRIQAGCAAKA